MPEEATVTQNNPGSSETEPRTEWYYREKPGEEIHGPLTFQHAEAGARELSENEELSGLAEILTYVGSRAGDPVKDTPELRVVYMYVRGKRVLAGRAAQYHSDNGLPPTK